MILVKTYCTTMIIRKFLRDLRIFNYISWCKYSTQVKKEIKIDMKNFPTSRIRNFGIIAHIDHGKSTLSDRLMEFTGNISKENRNQQVLDSLQVERERGITVKAQTVSLLYKYKGDTYLLNLIDTPGHVDFSYEVSRSLAACQGVILLVDANQGVQAQTVANFNLAFGQELIIIPTLNKIDLKNARPEVISQQLVNVFGIEEKDILKVSAKLGTGIEDLLNAIVERIPPPNGDVQKPFRALLYDSWYSQYRYVISLIMVVDGSLNVGTEVISSATGNEYTIKELGILFPEEIPVKELFAGQAGYFSATMKNPKEAIVGDTWYEKGSPVELLPAISSSKPMVFAGIYPSDQSRAQELKKAIDKLMLNDPSVTLSVESSPALGLGYRLGFLGLLHMEVFCQRLDQEFDAQVIVSTPAVPYKFKITGEKNIKKYRSDEITITNPLEFPEPSIITECYEPMVLATIISPIEYYSDMLNLCLERRGDQKSCQNIDSQTIMFVYKFPMNEIIVDFFNELKTISSGYASFDYEEIGYEPTQLKRIGILLNGKMVEELATIAHATRVEKVGRYLCLRLKDSIEPHLFMIAIQAMVGGKVVARENIKALRKNVAAKLYGGDVTRKMKLLQRQKEGKKHMRMIGNVQVPRDVFIKILRR